MDYYSFTFTPVSQKPVIDLSPHHVRMACCYRDKTNVYHLFTDFIDSSLYTIHSWQARIDYFSGTSLDNLNFIGTVVERGNEKLDCYGVGSPDVLCLNREIHLFYSARGSLQPDREMNSLAKPGEPGYVSGDIMHSSAPADEHGAPLMPFVKKGTAVKRENEWEMMRIDDPCVIRDNKKLFLYYKGFHDNTCRNNMKLGFAESDISKIMFSKQPNPLLTVRGGLEMPRVFKYKDTWNMFLRHYEKQGGTTWKQYVSKDGKSWDLYKNILFDCAGPNPGKGATDMMLIKDFNGGFTGLALATGMEKGCLKLWLYNVAAEILSLY